MRLLTFVASTIWLFASKGEEITPRINHPTAANGGSVQALMLKLLTLKAMMAAMPAPSRERDRTSATLQLRQAHHKASESRATNTMRTGRPPIAPNSRYELWGWSKGFNCAGTR